RPPRTWRSNRVLMGVWMLQPVDAPIYVAGDAPARPAMERWIPDGACRGARSAPRHAAARSGAREHQGGVGAAEAETVRHHGVEPRLAAGANDREALGPRVELVDVCGAGDEAVAHHQQAVDRLVHA